MSNVYMSIYLRALVLNDNTIYNAQKIIPFNIKDTIYYKNKIPLKNLLYTTVVKDFAGLILAQQNSKNSDDFLLQNSRVIVYKNKLQYIHSRIDKGYKKIHLQIVQSTILCNQIKNFLYVYNIDILFKYYNTLRYIFVQKNFLSSISSSSSSSTSPSPKPPSSLSSPQPPPPTTKQTINSATNTNKETEKKLNITNSCIEQLRKQQETKYDNRPIIQRIIVNSGGCSGYRYEFLIEEASSDILKLNSIQNKSNPLPSYVQCIGVSYDSDFLFIYQDICVRIQYYIYMHTYDIYTRIYIHITHRQLQIILVCHL